MDLILNYLLILILILSPLFSQNKTLQNPFNDKTRNFSVVKDMYCVSIDKGVEKSILNSLVPEAEVVIENDNDFEDRTIIVIKINGGGDSKEKVKKLKDEKVIRKYIPLYIDDSGDEVYMDTEIVTLQLTDQANENQLKKILKKLNSKISLKFRTEGYYGVTIPKNEEIFEFMNLLFDFDEILFAEPFIYGHNDLTGELLRGVDAEDYYLSSSWHLENTGSNQGSGFIAGNDINARNAWNITYGHPSVCIVVIDSGIDEGHPDLMGNIVPRNNEDWDFMNDTQKAPTDIIGHGTAVAGIIAAEMNSFGVRGIAPNCKIMPLKAVVGATGVGWRADAINYAITRKDDFLGMVINCSWVSTYSSALYNAIRNAEQNDIPLVFSSGNDGYHIVRFPAADPFTISVGAMYPHNYVRPSYSVYGEDLDIVAPGDKIYTTDMRTDIYGNVGLNPTGQIPPVDLTDLNYTKLFNQTSAAAPMVSGTIALILSANLLDPPDPNMIKSLLIHSAHKIGSYDYDWSSSKPDHSWEFGYGRLDAYGALAQIPEDPLTVSITGPSSLNPGQEGAYYADALGGFHGYEYQWYYLNNGNWLQVAGEIWHKTTLTFSTSTQVKCVISDVVSHTATSNIISVSIGSGALLKEETTNMAENLPTKYDLLGNYPNPFNPSTLIKYNVPVTSNVRLTIYNMMGQEVRSFESDGISAGTQSFTWSGTNKNNEQVASGIYIYKLHAIGNDGRTFSKSSKMMLLK